jgi:hypothetical protein
VLLLGAKRTWWERTGFWEQLVLGPFCKPERSFRISKDYGGESPALSAGQAADAVRQIRRKTMIRMIRVSAIVIAASIAVANLTSPTSAQAENSNATAQIGTKELNATKSQSKAVVSGGNDMGTYIDAVQNNFGNPNVVVTLPTNDAIGK